MFDSLIEFLIVVLIPLLLYLGWKSTEVRDTNLYPSATAINRSHNALVRDVAIVPVRGNLLNRLVDQITAGSTGVRIRRRRPWLQARLPNSVEQVEYNEGNILMTHVLSWDSEDNIAAPFLGEDTDEGPEAIIREMDRDLDDTATGSSATTPTSSTEQSPVVEEVQNCTNENSENGSKQQVVADAIDSASGSQAHAAGEAMAAGSENEETWKIKIKYLNDEMKVVDAHPSQTLGEFKRINFQSELSANKLVRLVFNGKVLQPDGCTLRSCALFENCVVHCLVHNMPANASSFQPVSSGSGTSPRETMSVVEYTPPTEGPQLLGGPQPQERRQETESDTGLYATINLVRHRLEHWLLGQWNRLYNWRFYTETMLIVFTLITIYLRVRYAELFTATATIGLVIASAMVFGISVTLNIL